jgi:TonB family protein
MNRIFLIGVCILVLGQASVAQGVPTQSANPQDVQTRAQALFDRARSLSDIRSGNAPAFHLKATFSYGGEALEMIDGTYEETWASPTQWRREITVGNSTHIEVRALSKTYVLDKPNNFPEKAKQILTAIEVFPSGPAKLAFESISGREDTTPPVDCLVTKAGAMHQRSAFCFERKSGLLFEKVSPEFRRGAMFSYSCDYGKFEKFEDDWFPRQIACFEERHKVIEAKVVDVSAVASLSPELLVPPVGAIELGVCSGTLHPPAAVSTRDPNPPSGLRDEVAPVLVTLSVVVDIKGNPQNVKVLRPGRKNFDDSAISAVRGWRFKPATCDGEPMALPMNVEVAFQPYR